MVPEDSLDIPSGAPQVPVPNGAQQDEEDRAFVQEAYEDMIRKIVERDRQRTTNRLPAHLHHIAVTNTTLQKMYTDRDTTLEPPSRQIDIPPSRIRKRGSNTDSGDKDLDTEDDIDTGDTRSHRKRKASKEENTDTIRFTKMTTAVATKYDLTWMGNVRTIFYTKVAADPNWKLDKDVVGFVNYIFTEMFGQGRQRVLNILREYEAQSDEHIGHAVGVRAENLSHDPHVPEDVRPVFGSLATMVRLEARRESDFGGLVRHLQLLRLLESYNVMINAYRKKDPTILVLLAPYIPGGKRRQGISTATIVQQYIINKLGIQEQKPEIKKFSNYLNNAQAIKTVVDICGRGILAILPKSAYYRFVSANIGIKRIKTAIPILTSTVPWLVDLCEMLDTHIVGPIEQGGSIPIHVYGRDIGNTVEALLTQDSDDNYDIVDVNNNGEDGKDGEERMEEGIEKGLEEDDQESTEESVGEDTEEEDENSSDEMTN